MDKRVHDNIILNRIRFLMTNSQLFNTHNIDRGRIEIPHSNYYLRMVLLHYNYGGWIGWRKINHVPIITEEMLKYYHEHPDDAIFSFPVIVSFEEVFDQCNVGIKDFFIFNLDLFR